MNEDTPYVPQDPLRQEWFLTLTRTAPEFRDEQKLEQFIELMFRILTGHADTAFEQPIFEHDTEIRKAAFVLAMQQLGDAMTRRRFCDLLGEVHQLIRSKRSLSSTGSFYTPMDISDLMAAATRDEHTLERLKRGELISVADEAVGAGRLLLSFAAQYPDYLPQLRFYGTDIEAAAVKMCFVNCTLNGMAATIRHGNALTRETWAVYRTFEWAAYRGAEMIDTMRKLLLDTGTMLAPPEKQEQKPTDEIPFTLTSD